MTRILIADDNSQNLYMLETILKANSYEVVSATNGAEALDIARKEPPDLIITDILMPAMDGFELCRRWKADDILKGIPFIFYTANYTDIKDEQFALSLGADRFVVKPQQPEELVKIIKNILEEFDKGEIIPLEKAPGEEIDFLQKHNEVLLRKLEMKTVQLDRESTEREQAEERLRELERVGIDDEEPTTPYYLLIIYKANGLPIYEKKATILSMIPKMDANLIAGMISGITSFLGEVLSGNEQLSLLDRNNVKMLFEYSPNLMGILFLNKDSPKMRQELKNILLITEKRCGSSISKWTGDISKYDFIDELTSKIIQ